jgi:predicted PurR-regulated permease PerM
MTRFLKWRKMTWALLLWGVLIGLWMISGTFVLALMAGALGLIVLSAIWWLTRPLWCQGHGLRFRRMRSVEIPFKPVKSFSSSPR